MIKVLYEGVVYLVSRFVKVIALIIIGAMAIGLLSILVGTHFSLPYLRLVSPEPWFTGYVAYYAGLIAFVVIPFLLLILLVSKLVWRHRRIHRYRYPIAGVWTVSAMIFASTAFFMAKGFMYETSVTEEISHLPINQEKNFMININEAVYDNNHPFMMSLGDAVLSKGRLYKTHGVQLDFEPTESDEVVVSRTRYSRGLNYKNALLNMTYPKHNIEISDHDISLDDFYKMTSRGKFRDQRFHYKVGLPVGTKLSFNRRSCVFSSKKAFSKEDTLVMTKEGLIVQEESVI